MKKIIITAMVAILSFSLQAQDAVSKFFNKYADDESFTTVNITSRMFGLFTDLELDDKEDQEVLDAIGKLKGLKILGKEGIDNGKELYREAFDLIPRKEYDELMSVRDKATDIKFLIKEKDGKVSELLMIMGGNKEFFILSLFGEIDLKQVAKISRAMDIDGLEQLEKIDGN